LLLGKDGDRYTAWHIAALFDGLMALETLRSLAEELELNLDEMLLAKTEGGQTAFHLAAQRKHTEILWELWVWVAKSQMNPSELRKTLLLAKNEDGYTAWHRAAISDGLETLETSWSLSKEAEIKLDEFLLVKTEQGQTAFHMAAKENHIEILQKL